MRQPGLQGPSGKKEPTNAPHLRGSGSPDMELRRSCPQEQRGVLQQPPQERIERVSDFPCLLLILKTLIAFQKMFPQNCKKVKSTNKEHHKQDQSQNCDSILPNQSIVSKERLHRDK